MSKLSLRRTFRVRTARDLIILILQYGIMLLFAFICIVPFYWMLITSVKTRLDAIKIPPNFFPWPPYWDNYKSLLERTVLGKSILNSFIISITALVGVLFSTSIAAYAFSKITFKGKSPVFGVLIATMLIPGQVTMIPLYVIFSRLGWVDTYLPLIVPQVMVNAYGVFMLRQFMAGIPDSYGESAQLDGAGHFRIYSTIILPLCKPALITLGLFNFIGNWNNFMGPLIYLNTDTKFTVPLVINMLKEQYRVDWGFLMAASTISVLPIAVLYFASQKFFIEGIALSGLKG